MFEALTGTGLAASAGLNAYIPLLMIGLLGRFTHLVTLPHGWNWLSNGWVLVILGILLAVEMVADKVPVVDHANDVLQTVVRPTAGGLVFGAGSASKTETVTDPASFFGSHQWVPVAAGVLIALCVHSVKAVSRPVINATTLGVGAPIASTLEDFSSVALSFAAILLPLLVLVGLALMVWGATWVVRRRRRRKRERAAVTGSETTRVFG